MNICFGFERNYFNSYFFDRTFLSDNQKEKINIFSFDNKYQESSDEIKFGILINSLSEKDKFFFHSPNLFKEIITSYSYKYNILFLCTMVWISGLFIRKFLDKSEENENDDKNSLKKKILRYILFSIILIFWGFYIFEGVLNFTDNLIFYHKLISYNYIKFLDWQIIIYLIISYLHFYLFIFLISFTLVSHFKLKQKMNLNNHINTRNSLNSQVNHTKISADSFLPDQALNINEINISCEIKKDMLRPNNLNDLLLSK
jgi:hypothetical protein